MKTTPIIALIFTGILASGFAHAQEAHLTSHLWADNHLWLEETNAVTEHHEEETPLFRANEFSFDLFASYISPERKVEDFFQTDLRHGFWGGGAGVNYFLLKFVGVGGDFNVSAKPETRLVDYAMGNVYLRLPFDTLHLAPYVYGGGGRGISPIYEWLFDAGIGLEFRLNRRFGFFGDGRYIWAEKSFDRALFRTGLRVVL